MPTTLAAFALAVAASGAAQQDLPLVTVTADNTRIDRSCRVEFAPDAVIADADGNGVIQIVADGITVEFAPDAALRGAPAGTPWDTLAGTGIRIDGAADVTLRNARVHGYHAGIWATNANGLTIDGADVSDNYRAHLKSTPVAEDGSDWLSAHHNDENQWLSQYGAAIYIEDSRAIDIHDVTCRRGQNGILLDRVDDSKIYDNDCSFLSGWGLGLWRSNRNTISRNAFDFCVRGHVEGVYNRGQDSAGILCFEQCNDNVFAENSATHGGDCFFAFAGLEAIGDNWLNKERQRLRREHPGQRNIDSLIEIPDDVAADLSAKGCNRNLLIANDFSYAPAHGIEMTFSEGNIFAKNRLVQNAICGVWGGYSQDTLIAENLFEGNGGMAYGLERGGVNMEHGSGNTIVANTFRNNLAAVHFWWDPDPGPNTLPGVMGNYRGASENIISGNTFILNADHPFTSPRHARAELVILQLRGTPEHVHDNAYDHNKTEISIPNGVEFRLDEGLTVDRDGETPDYEIPDYTAYGQNSPVGARPDLRGRDAIIMTEWGPWDHESPMVRLLGASAAGRQYQVFGVQGPVKAELVSGEGASVSVEQSATGASSDPAVVTISGAGSGVLPYKVRLSGKDLDEQIAGTFVSTKWEAKFWTWQTDPLEDVEAWRKEVSGDNVITVATGSLDFNYGFGGPKDQHISDEINASDLGSDKFSMIARTTIPLDAGKWRIKTLSDDGVRVFIDGNQVLERWDIHGPTPDQATFDLAEPRDVEFVVEHFENDGYAVFQFQIEAAE